LCPGQGQVGRSIVNPAPNSPPASPPRPTPPHERLSKGESYADVAEWLQTELRPKGASAKKKDGYRRAADIVEVFAPVVWNDWLSIHPRRPGPHTFRSAPAAACRDGR